MAYDSPTLVGYGRPLSPGECRVEVYADGFAARLGARPSGTLAKEMAFSAATAGIALSAILVLSLCRARGGWTCAAMFAVLLSPGLLFGVYHSIRLVRVFQFRGDERVLAVANGTFHFHDRTERRRPMLRPVTDIQWVALTDKPVPMLVISFHLHGLGSGGTRIVARHVADLVGLRVVGCEIEDLEDLAFRLRVWSAPGRERRLASTKPRATMSGT